MIPLILRCQGVGLFNLIIPWKTQLLFIVMVSYVPAMRIDKFIMMSHAVCRRNTVPVEIHERTPVILYRLPLRIVSKRNGSSSKTIHFQGLYIFVFLGEYSSTRLPTCHVHLVFFAEVEKESCTIDLWDSSGLLPDLPVPSVCLGLPPI